MPSRLCADRSANRSFPRSLDRSHALRGNASSDALRHNFKTGRGASWAAFPRRAWERSVDQPIPEH
ncbi:DUF1534 domain-containing protein [Pseudomonas sp. WS 5146]|nr:DUF1534 domain-containing protein [Pseudomonas sp. WS 5146]